MNRLKVQWHRWYSTAIGRSGVAVSRLQLHSYRAVHRNDWQKFTMSANLQRLITVFLRDPPHPSGHTQAQLYVLYKFCSRKSRLSQVRISFSEFLPNFVKYCRYSYVLMYFLINWRFLAQENQNNIILSSLQKRAHWKLTSTSVGLTKCTIYWRKCYCFCSCFSLCCYYAHFSD